MQIKTYVCTACGIIGAAVAQLFGGWTAAMTTLVILMGADYATGLMVAGIFRASPKTEGGGLESRAGFKGLCRKAVILVFVLIAARLDMLIGTAYIKDSVCIGFMANELISIVENAGLMGIPLPAAVKAAVELLRSKAGDSGDTEICADAENASLREDIAESENNEDNKGDEDNG